jgi:negative regulator of flagellin synthesis FlgM
MGLDINGIGTSQANAGKTRTTPAARSADINPGTASSSAKPGQDTVSISAEAKALSQLPELTKGAAFDEAKVEALRLAIENGTYKPDPGRIANALLKLDELF